MCLTSYKIDDLKGVAVHKSRCFHFCAAVGWWPLLLMRAATRWSWLDPPAGFLSCSERRIDGFKSYVTSFVIYKVLTRDQIHSSDLRHLPKNLGSKLLSNGHFPIGKSTWCFITQTSMLVPLFNIWETHASLNPSSFRNTYSVTPYFNLQAFVKISTFAG